MHIDTHHTAKTTRGLRYWRAVLQHENGERAYVEIMQSGVGYGYGYVVSTDGFGSHYSGHHATLGGAIRRSAHYAWHITHPDERNPYA